MTKYLFSGILLQSIILCAVAVIIFIYGCVPVFHSDKEKDGFLKYASSSFKSDYDFTRHPRKPTFPKSLQGNQTVEFFKQQYYDALIIVDMLANYRMSQTSTNT